MLRSPRALSVPLAAVSAVALVGGVGNVAFTLHAGSQVQLALVRFAFGLLLSALVVLLRRRRREGRPSFPLHVSAAAGAAAIVTAMLSARTVPVLLLTLTGLLSPALLLSGSRLIGLPDPSRRQVALASVAVAAAAASSLPAASATSPSSTPGVVLLLVSTLSGVVSTLLWVRFSGPSSPERHVLRVSAWGFALAASASAVLGPGPVPASTLLSGLFIAAVPGTAGMLVVSYAVLHVPPFLVAAVGTLSLLPALAFDVLRGSPPTLMVLLLSAVSAAAAVAVQFVPSRLDRGAVRGTVAGTGGV